VFDGFKPLRYAFSRPKGQSNLFASELVFNATRRQDAIETAANQQDQPDFVQPSSLQSNQQVTSSKNELFRRFGQLWLNLAQHAVLGRGSEQDRVPQGRLKIGRDAILENLQVSLLRLNS
jgi:hypothetical protein